MFLSVSALPFFSPSCCIRYHVSLMLLHISKRMAFNLISKPLACIPTLECTLTCQICLFRTIFQIVISKSELLPKSTKRWKIELISTRFTIFALIVLVMCRNFLSMGHHLHLRFVLCPGNTSSWLRVVLLSFSIDPCRYIKATSSWIAGLLFRISLSTSEKWNEIAI